MGYSKDGICRYVLPILALYERSRVPPPWIYVVYLHVERYTSPENRYTFALFVECMTYQVGTISAKKRMPAPHALDGTVGFSSIA